MVHTSLRAGNRFKAARTEGLEIGRGSLLLGAVYPEVTGGASGWMIKKLGVLVQTFLLSSV